MKRIDSILQRAAVILIMLILAVPGVSSAQVAGTDFAPGSYFTVESDIRLVSGILIKSLEVYNTNPHASPVQRVKVMTIPNFENSWRTDVESSPAYDMVRHRLYQAVSQGEDQNKRYYVIWIDPVTSQWGKVELPSQCANVGVSSQVTVDSSTGSLFCTGATFGDGSESDPFRNWIVRINPDNGNVMALKELSFIAVDPRHHVLYATDRAGNIVTMDTQSPYEVRTTGAVSRNDAQAMCDNPPHPLSQFHCFCHGILPLRFFFAFPLRGQSDRPTRRFLHTQKMLQTCQA
jgi:hypothetical protein